MAVADFLSPLFSSPGARIAASESLLPRIVSPASHSLWPIALRLLQRRDLSNHISCALHRVALRPDLPRKAFYKKGL